LGRVSEPSHPSLLSHALDETAANGYHARMSVTASEKMPDASGHFWSVRRPFRARNSNAPAAGTGGRIFSLAARPGIPTRVRILPQRVLRPTDATLLCERLTRELGGAKIISSAKICSTPGRIKSTIASARCCWRGAWERHASSRKRGPANMAWPRRLSPPCSASNASFTWARSIASARRLTFPA